jgi:hypothetical protein
MRLKRVISAFLTFRLLFPTLFEVGDMIFARKTLKNAPQIPIVWEIPGFAYWMEALLGINIVLRRAATGFRG